MSTDLLRAEAMDRIRADRLARLARCEDVLAALDTEDRLAVASWLGGMLRRPPLLDARPEWRAIRAVVDALWWDLCDRTHDPLSPVVAMADGDWLVPIPHPRLFEGDEP